MIGTPVFIPSTHPLSVLINLTHYEAAEDIDWNVKVQLTRMADATFASRLSDFDADSSSSQTNWFTRDEQTDASTGVTWVAMPAGGFNSFKSKARALGHVATVLYIWTTAGDLAQVDVGEQLLVRAAQWNGSAWGEWTALDPITVGA